MRTKELQLQSVEDKAIELYAHQPEITHIEVASTLGIHITTLRRLRRTPDFWQKYYNYYMVTFEKDVVDCLKAAVREGKAGNVQAIKLVLEHSGKLVSGGDATLSPFEQWFMSNVEGIKNENTEDAEIVDEFIELPPRTADNSPEKARKELNELNSAMNKAKSKNKWNQQRREQYKWLKRAKAAGVKPLSARRPTPGQKKTWRDKIIAAEKIASEHSPE
tara:strand:- start:150 stop:806 length:657 start_codon:yes stop_codon:yes gene_type:complete